MSSPPGGDAGTPADSLCDRNVHDPATLRDVSVLPQIIGFAKSLNGAISYELSQIT